MPNIVGKKLSANHDQIVDLLGAIAMNADALLEFVEEKKGQPFTEANKNFLHAWELELLDTIRQLLRSRH